MAKLTKQESKLHLKAMELVHSDKPLSMDERLFILANYQESSGNTNSLAGAFFTPWGLAKDTMLEVGSGGVIVDLCAGIGALSLAALHQCEPELIISVELNADYLAVGQRVVPEATWLHGDVFDIIPQLVGMGSSTTVISNPPFGQIGTGKSYSGAYSGGEFEFKLIEAARNIGSHGVFILPQMSTPFKYSGQRQFSEQKSDKYSRFTAQTGLVFEFNCGIDTGGYIKEWHGVSPMCEIVTVEY